LIEVQIYTSNIFWNVRISGGVDLDSTAHDMAVQMFDIPPFGFTFYKRWMNANNPVLTKIYFLDIKLFQY